MNKEIEDVMKKSEIDALERTRKFIETYYSKDLANAAIEYAKSRPEEVRELQDQAEYTVFMNYVEDVLSGKKEFDKDAYEVYKSMLETLNRTAANDNLVFTFVRAAQWVKDNPNAGYHAEITAQYRKDKDFAVSFCFHDNDFGGYFEDAAREFCKEYNRLLDQMDIYSKHESCDNMIKSYIEDLEYMERPNVLKETMKSLFIGAYMGNAADRILLSHRHDSGPTMKGRLDKALDYMEYLGFDREESWMIGKREDFERVKKEFEDMQDDNMKDLPFEKYWLNGEVLIMFMEEGRLTYMVR
jgi:hypothetical protein